MKQLVCFCKRYSEIFKYLVIGGFTTIFNLFIKYLLLFTVLDADNPLELQLAVVISWIASVVFAYVFNRGFVFCSKNEKILKEIINFYSARVITLLLEMFIIWFFITFLSLNSNMWVFIFTILSQILVIVLNYIFSKLFVFKIK